MRMMLTLSAITFFTILILPIAMGISQEQVELPTEQIEDAVSEIGESRLVTMDFEEAEIRDVIKVLAMASGMNMVIGEDVQAKVTISLKEMPWEKALDVILRTYNFTYKREENLIRIMTFEKVKQEERDIPLATKIIYLNFADVSELKGPLTKMLSDRGSIEVDERTNSMVISDIPTKLEETEKIAKKLDTRTPQVLIEAMLVDVKLTKEDELGINWKILQVNMPEDQFGKGDENFIELPADPMTDLTSTAITLGFLKRLGSYGIDGLISAWVEDAKANILASPKIVTLDNQTAIIEIKSQVPYTETTTTDQGVVTTTQFKDVITSLEVTPHITKEGFVSMSIEPKQEFVERFIGATNEPQIGSRRAKTNVLIEDGETIVIGGLRKVEDNATLTKVPFLGDIPFLGNLFRKKDIQKINTELVMFVTPQIIVRPELTDEEIDSYERLDDAREIFLESQEKERQKRLKRRRKRQAMFIEPDITEHIPLSGANKIAAEEIPTLPATKKTGSELETDPDYIYVW